MPEARDTWHGVQGIWHFDTHDWQAAILRLLRLDHMKLTFNYGGRNFRLTNVSGEVAKGILS